jgi:hypothetical protein
MDRKDLIFEEEIIQGLKDITPPEEEILEINPWMVPISSIAWGLILTTIRLNFLFLQYLLPTIGVALTFVGFRSLRNQNNYFRVLYYISLGRLLLHLVDTIVIGTPLNLMDIPSLGIGLVRLIIQVFTFLVFHMGLREVYKGAGRTMELSPLVWVSLWTILAFFIAITPLAETWLAFLPMIIFYILIIKAIFSIGEDLDDTGYLIKNAPVKISNTSLRNIYLLLVVVVGLGSNMYFNNLKLDSHEFIPPVITSIREDLLNKGFPAEALRYLAEDDLGLLGDAINIEVKNELLMFDPRVSQEVSGSGYFQSITNTHEPGKKNIDSTTIYIEMPDNILYVMQYFKWKGGRPIWQDAIMLTGQDEVEDRQIISSSLFYSKKDKEYRANFPRLIMEGVEKQSFFGPSWIEPIRASFSFPLGSKDQGGYILYRYGRMESDIYLVPVLFEYIHQSIPIRIPYIRSEDLFLQGGYGFSNNYKQHYSTYESLGMKEVSE